MPGGGDAGQVTGSLSWAGLGQYKRVGVFGDTYPSLMRRFFAPGDDVHGVLMAVLSSARLSVAGSMYGYDDDEVNALLLKHAHDPLLPVQLALDKSQAGGVHEKALVAEWPHDVIGNSLVIGQSVKHAINHLKLFVIDGVYTIGGSTNLSTGGEASQNNELIVVMDPTYAAESRAKIDLCISEMRHQMNPVAVE